jgi:hypothetical protein
MARYKGQQNSTAVERNYPHIVEMVVPLGGLGKRLDAIYDFHAHHGIKLQHGRGRREGGRNIICWCFADPMIAAAFVIEFAELKCKGRT